ncbi:lipothrixviral RHH transcriptional regulator [Sulfolobus islandicus filamentous virus 2]|uniref:Lipothrixviral RHH transcriptional regulator n=1 Tax=Sulfolobus islandicus filamentous virus 2 TaxID=1902331 RepID=A0A1D8BJ63_SIFV|nr:lipothrixviral RHH transcriptional regulator [Sulfolobus islandicus filamentous virus 2]
MIKKIIITTIDTPTDDKNVKFLVGLAKLIGKNEISFGEDKILKKDVSKNDELREITQEIISKYKEKVPSIVKFKEGKIKSDGKIIIRWEYENKS